MSERTAIQDLIPENYCYGCGPGNEHGLQIKSYWEGDGASCTFVPKPYHAAGPKHVLYGGTIASIVDCHSINTAIEHARQRGVDPKGLWYVTASLKVDYLKPTPLNGPVELFARVTEHSGRKSIVECSVSVDGVETAKGRVVAVSVPADWRQE